MKMVAVTTLRDAAGAEVAREMLAERGIDVEIKRLGMNAYFGAPTAEEFEVRVPEESLVEAQRFFEAMHEELERAALAEAGVPPDDDDVRGGDDLPPPELRERKVSWAVALGLVGPIPGCGVLYARAFALGWTMVGLSLALFVGAIAINPDLFPLLIALKAADVVIAPFAAARFNRKLREHHGARS
jgi:hypothetical protein